MGKLPGVYRIIIKILLIIILIGSIPYYFSVIYDFSKSTPFSGNIFYNPYENISNNWVKANFHAHSKAFFGLTNGKCSDEQIYHRYDSMHYGLSCLSNYNSISKEVKKKKVFLHNYEHGINFNFTHQLVINETQTFLFDYPFVLSTSEKQFIINKLKSPDNIVILAHPAFNSGYNLKDMEMLNNYDCIEIISPRVTSPAYWDMALSSGHVVWAVGNDDAHDISDGNSGVCWTMLNVNNNTKEEILHSLKTGSCYPTKGWLGQEMFHVKKVCIKNNVYSLNLDDRIDSIILKSDNGQTVAYTTKNDSISYTVKPNNTYIRAELYKTEVYNKYTRSYLNPVIRTINGTFIKHNNTVTINILETTTFILLLLLFHLFIVVAVVKLK